MRKNNNLDFDFMDGIYDVLNSSDEIVYGDDDIIYVDDEETYYHQEDELSWVDDVEIIGEFEEDTFNFEDLGEGYIPLPKGIQEEVQVIIIDENYILPDDFEEFKLSADGQSTISNVPREGFVYRSLDGSQSFKNVSREFLLKHS